MHFACVRYSFAIIIVLQVSTELLQKYLDLEKNVILRFFLRFAGEHLMHDTSAMQYLHYTESGHVTALPLTRHEGAIARGSWLPCQAVN